MTKRNKPGKSRNGSGSVIRVDFKKRPSNEQVARDVARRDIMQRASFLRFQEKMQEEQDRKRHKLHDRIFYTACVVLTVIGVRLVMYLLGGV